MSDDPVLAAIEALGAILRGEIIKTRTEIIERTDSLQTTVDTMIIKTRTEIMERTDSLQTTVDAIRDDLTVLGGANDAIRRTNENTRDEVRDLARTLGDMQRVLLKHGSRLDQLERRRP